MFQKAFFTNYKSLRQRPREGSQIQGIAQGRTQLPSPTAPCQPHCRDQQRSVLPKSVRDRVSLA
jgi:hypothetical protein